MTLQRTSWSVGVLVEAERELALKEFTAEHPEKLTPELALAWHVRQIDQVITHKPGGLVLIHTHVMGKRKVDDLQRFEQYATIPSGHGRRDHHPQLF